MISFLLNEYNSFKFNEIKEQHFQDLSDQINRYCPDAALDIEAGSFPLQETKKTLSLDPKMVIGKGSWGLVLQYQDDFVIKVPHPGTSSESNQLLREAVCWFKLQALCKDESHFFAKVIECSLFEVNGSLLPCLITKKYRGSLYYLYGEYGFGPTQEKLAQQVHKIALQTFDALSFMHRHGLIHCDLNLSNVVYDEEFSAYLVDFGETCSLLAPENMLTTICLPHAYRPPEFLLNGRTKEMDIYSLGKTLFYVLLKTNPDRRSLPNQEFETYSSNQIKARFCEEKVHVELKHLIEIFALCIKGNPDLRPQATDVLKKLNEPAVEEEKPPPQRGSCRIL